MRKSKRSFEPDTEDPITYYYRELDESPPRAAIALVVASFERRLEDAILVLFNRLRGSQNPLQLSSKERKDLKATLPRSVHDKVQLGYGMGIFPRCHQSRRRKGVEGAQQHRSSNEAACVRRKSGNREGNPVSPPDGGVPCRRESLLARTR